MGHFSLNRVAANEDLVKDLYWQLCNRTVVDKGKERKLRVFWDRVCRQSGERWEEGFVAAIWWSLSCPVEGHVCNAGGASGRDDAVVDVEM